MFYPGGSLSIDRIALGSVVYTCRRFSKSVPEKGLASSLKLFLLFSGVLLCQWGLIPCRTKSCGVLDPQNIILRGIRPRGTKSCWVSDPAEHRQSCVHFMADACSAGYDTLQNNVLRGLIPQLTKSCRVSNHGKQLQNMNISANSKQNSEIF
jgi:hypothetical protein